MTHPVGKATATTGRGAPPSTRRLVRVVATGAVGLLIGGAGACGRNDQVAPAPVTAPVRTAGADAATTAPPDAPDTTSAVPTTGTESTTTRPATTSRPTEPSVSTTSVPAGPTTSPPPTPAGPPGGPTGPTVTISPGQVQQIPAGTSPEEKAWCVRAKPLSQALNQMWTLSQQQFETLVNQALELKTTAPAAIQTQLGQLATVGSRFLAAVKAGQATISPDGITRWANQNLSPAEQVGFLQSAGAVTSYINRTC